jgi:hypothetical protein
MARTSLAHKDRNVHEVLECPRVDWRLMDELSGLIVPASCKSYSCAVCGPKKARSWVGASVMFGRPERFLRLSRLPEDPSECLRWMRNLRHRLNKEFRTEWLYVVEGNPKGTGNHGHVLQHGEFIPQADLQDMAGGRIPYIEKIRGGSASSYAMKGFGAGGYALKGFDGESDKYFEHLSLNNGRPVHYSRGFFRSESGEKMSATNARKNFLRSLAGEEERRWVRIPKALAVE